VTKQIIAGRPRATPASLAGVLHAWSSSAPSYTHWFPARMLLRLVSTPPTAIEVEALRRLREKFLTSDYRS
jgi:hypothetical protein